MGLEKVQYMPNTTTDLLNSEGHIGLPKEFRETNGYRILAIGPFGKLVHQFQSEPWLPPAPIIPLVHEKWQQALRADQEKARQTGQPSRLYPGPQFRLETVNTENGTLTVVTRPISYNLYVGARDEAVLTPIAKEHGLKTLDLAAQPLNVSAMVVTADGFIPVQKRSLEVDVDPGMVYLAGGQLRDSLSEENKKLATGRGNKLAQTPLGEVKPTDFYVYREVIRQVVSPLMAVVAQIVAETGIPQEHLKPDEAILLGLIQAKGAALHPELVFVIPCGLSYAEAGKFMGQDAWEGKFKSVSADPDKIEAEIRTIGEPVPILQGALALYTHYTS